MAHETRPAKRQRLTGVDGVGAAPPLALSIAEANTFGYANLWLGYDWNVPGLRTMDFHYDLTQYYGGDGILVGNIPNPAWHFQNVVAHCLNHARIRGGWVDGTIVHVSAHIRLLGGPGGGTVWVTDIPDFTFNLAQFHTHVTRIRQKLEAVLDSQQTAEVEFITVGFTLPPVGGTFAPLTHDNVVLGRKRGIKKIYTKPWLKNCAAKALCYLYAKKFKQRINPELEDRSVDSNYGRKGHKRHEEDGLWLCRKAGIEPTESQSFDQLQKFIDSKALGDRVRIAVFILQQQRNIAWISPHPDHVEDAKAEDGESFPEPRENFREEGEGDCENFYLFWTQQGGDGHYDAVPKPNCVWNTPKFCQVCQKGYSSDDSHKCLAKCTLCMKPNCDGYKRSLNPPENWVWEQCGDCNRKFFGLRGRNDCFANHKKASKKGSTCERIWQCNHASCLDPKRPLGNETKKMNFLYSRVLPENHVEGEVHWCYRCEEMVALEHPCHLVAPEASTLAKVRDNVWYFDMETRFQNWQRTLENSRDMGPIDKHRNLHVVDWIDCQRYDHDDSDPDDPFGDPATHRTFASVDSFMNFVLDGFFDGSPGKTLIAHNGRGYDFQFVRRWLLEHKDNYEPQVIRRGSKFLKLTIQKLGGVKASKQQITLLDSLNFIPTSLRSFPKTFGLRACKKGHFPHWFDRCENLGYVGPVPDWKCFRPWKMSKADAVDFYLWYQDEMVRTTPPQELDFSSLHEEVGAELFAGELPAISEGVTYTGPWVLQEQLEVYCADDVRVLRTGFESLRKNFQNLLPEHEVCSGPDPAMFTTINSLAQKVYMTYFMAAQDIAVLSNDQDSFIRRAMRGGRTEAFSLLYEIDQEREPDEEIKYVDFTSLYPAVNKKEKYPISHATIDVDLKGGPENWDILREADPLFAGVETTADVVNALCAGQGWGVVELDFKGPDNLFAPVLPYKEKGKTVSFDLLPHTNEVVCTRELVNAYQENYEFKNVGRIIWWNERNTTTGIFAQYVDKFYKEKIQAKGWPDDVKTQEEKEAYVAEIEARDGLKIDIDKVEKNKGRYFLFKQLLNCLWGRFGMRKNQVNHRTFYSDQMGEYWTLLTDPRYETSRNILVDKVSVEVAYRSKEEFVEPCENTNIAVAVATTAAARSWLYEKLLRPFGRRVLYMDTDSAILTAKPGESVPELGSALGDLTDELEGERAIAFTSGGAKNYSLLCVDREGGLKDYSKVKAFNLKRGWLDPQSACSRINFETMKQQQIEAFVDDVEESEREKTIVIYDDQIVRSVGSMLWDEKRGKTYRANFIKRRVIVGNKNGRIRINTLPHGFNEEADSSSDVSFLTPSHHF